MVESLTNINICTWNSRGLASSIPYLRTLCLQYEVVCVTEHWLHHNRLLKLGDISEDMNFFGRASSYSSSEKYGYSKGQGGVAILWNKKLRSVAPLCQIQHDRICAIRLQCNNDTIINIFCVYLPARGCADDIEVTLDELCAILDNTELGSFNILCGDFNADLGNIGGPRSHKRTDSRGRILHGFVHRYNLIPVNLGMSAIGPINTHYGPTGDTCIDYIMTPEVIYQQVTECIVSEYAPLNTSDHVPVGITLKTGGLPSGAVQDERASKIRWDKMTSEALNHRYVMPLGRDLEALNNRYEGVVLDEAGVEGLMSEIIRLIKHHAKVIPRSKYKGNVKPYWCPELTALKRQKIHAYRNWCEAGKPRNPDNPMYRANKVAKNLFRKRIKRISKEYDGRKIDEAIKSAELDHSVFWKMLKREKDGPKIKTPSIKSPDSLVVHDVTDILRVWETHFSSLGTPVESENFDRAHFNHVSDVVRDWISERDWDVFSDAPFTVEEVRKGISTLNSGKTPGYDEVSKEHLKHAGLPMCKVLVTLYNSIQQTEYIPINFRRGVQVPLYKGKNASILDVNNYRGITLLTTFNKLFEVIVWKRMERWWGETGVVSQLQGACRKGVSCVHSAYILQETIATLLRANQKVFVTYLDVSKAFDGVWVWGLFFRLRELGVRGKTWRILYKTYVDFKCRVRIQNQMSDWYPINCGIHQGVICL